MSYGGCWTAFGAVCWHPTWLMEAFGAVGSQPCWNVFGAVGWNPHCTKLPYSCGQNCRPGSLMNIKLNEREQSILGNIMGNIQDE